MIQEIIKEFDDKNNPCIFCLGKTLSKDCACLDKSKHIVLTNFLRSALERIAKYSVKGYDEELELKQTLDLYAKHIELGELAVEARKSALQKRGIEE